jgi:hypothetical protein
MNLLLTSSLSWWPTAHYRARKSPLNEPHKSNPAPQNLRPYTSSILSFHQNLGFPGFGEKFPYAISPTHAPLKKPTAAQPLKKFPAFDATRILITVFT